MNANDAAALDLATFSGAIEEDLELHQIVTGLVPLGLHVRRGCWQTQLIKDESSQTLLLAHLFSFFSAHAFSILDP